MRQPAKEKEREIFYAWLDTPPEERVPKQRKELCKQLGVSQVATYVWRNERERKRKDEELGLSPDRRFARLSSLIMEFTPQQIWEFKKKVYEKAMSPDAKAKDRELFGRLEGLIVEKKEHKVKVGFDADELARAEFEFERKRREWDESRAAGRVEIVQGESRLLPD